MEPPSCELVQRRVVKKYSPLFTLQRSLLYVRPPPSEPGSRSAMHYTPQFSSLPGFPPLFPLFLSQHDTAINKQLKKGNMAQGHCLLSSGLCLAFTGMVRGWAHRCVCVRRLAVDFFWHFIKARHAAFSSRICGYRYGIWRVFDDITVPFSWHLMMLTPRVPRMTFLAAAYDQS